MLYEAAHTETGVMFLWIKDQGFNLIVCYFKYNKINMSKSQFLLSKTLQTAFSWVFAYITDRIQLSFRVNYKVSNRDTSITSNGINWK